MEEIEGAARVLVGGAEDLAEVAGGLLVAERLYLDGKGALLTASDTEARGRGADEDLTEAVDPAGDTTLGRGAVVVVGLALVDEDKDGLNIGGADGLAGAIDARRFGAVPEIDVDITVDDGGGFEDAISVLCGGAETDFLRDGAVVVGLLATGG